MITWSLIDSANGQGKLSGNTIVTNASLRGGLTTFVVRGTTENGWSKDISVTVDVARSVSEAWTSERPIIVNNSNATNSSGYQVPIDLTSSNFVFSQSLANGEDLRFTDTDKTTQLSYWIESYDTNAEKARIWVKCDVPANASKTIYMYTGSSIATAKTNGNNVFNFFEDGNGAPTTAGTQTNRWNRYATPNPVLVTAAGEAIVGDPMVIPPDSLTNEWGFFYFVSKSGAVCDINYATINAEGKGVSSSSMVLDHNNTTYKRVLKPSVIYWAPANCYYMAVACENDGTNRVIALFKSTSRTSGWTFVKVLLTPDSSLIDASGNQVENTFIDCPNFCYNGTELRLYYSANESQNLEPRYFCLATFASGPESTLTRYANNPIAKANPATTWANKALGGQSVRYITSGERSGQYEFFYNAFTDGEVSRMGLSYSADGKSLTVLEGDLLLPLGGPGSSDRVRLYRPCGFNMQNQGAVADRVFYNALGDTETILYAEKGPTIDLTRWTLNPQGKPRVNFANGVMRVGDLRTNNDGLYFSLSSNYVPADNVIFETRARLDAVYDNFDAQFGLFMLTDGDLFPSNAYNNQFLFITKLNNAIRHQNRNSGNWGDEDTVAPFPSTGVFQKYRVTKKATSIDYEVFSDSGSSVGSLLNNTDPPQGATNLPFRIGGRGIEVSFDYIIARQYLPVAPSVSVGSSSPVQRYDL